MIELPASALQYGFRNPPAGTHSSRGLMLADLHTLLAACPRDAVPADYARAIEQDNVLAKPTASARRLAFSRLCGLYSLRRDVVVFKALLDLWDADHVARPLLALLCACARDPILRTTAATVLATPIGEPVTTAQLSEVAESAFPEHYSPSVITGIGWNTVSTWEQAGHLLGKLTRIRVHPVVTPVAVSYALLLAYLCDARGEGLFDTFWVRLLDRPTVEVRAQAVQAARHGWLEYRSVGGITEVEFRWLLGRMPVGAAS